MRVSVIGTGYLGAVHAACMAELGHEVLATDVDVARLESLSVGRAPFYEEGLPELLDRGLTTGRLRFTPSIREVGEFAEVHFICVGTPQQPDSGAADIRHIRSVVRELTPHLRTGCVVAGKSTVPVGTAARIKHEIAENIDPGTEFAVAWNPEFLREGFAVRDTLRPDRVVIGVETLEAADKLRAVYAPLLGETDLIVTDLATAELAKVAANSFLATKISFINAMAEICEVVGADVHSVADCLGRDSRIGRSFLSAGLGFGGGCLSKDIRAFATAAEELGAGRSLRFLREVDAINLRCRDRTVDLARRLVGGSFTGRNIAVLGATFKPNTDDVRDSPALEVAASVQSEGASVRLHDPRGIDNAREVYPALNYVHEVGKACEGADLTLHLTDWDDYHDIDPASLGSVTRCMSVLDARNSLDAPRWREAGWTVRVLGA
ncbi:UDP-glucose/GDP-mannose dehydrogenase family protein [Saccharopolyspora karakumensis]|uniref:UDP-glucose 6-dehydrogenase n=1 Tax=Saccharopolyspora karakumensis TaxID=2530386 RepID=A0A4R5BCI2_9PSEU|nr:UDP-glucose/GDP-mannose dehydrogenase family protein [Saccharopolyspora karakumensis]TDD83255.1 UDP-glucose/GDP-mannose dehydrogenase family protein [Saccharopolyspora karakumensis]